MKLNNYLNFRKLFSGTWKLTRYVSHPNISMNGKACFTETENGILYTENGAYEWQNGCQTCFQTYTYKLTPYTFTIFKHDGVLLHEGKVDETTTFPATVQHQHYCKDDIYKCRWIFHANDCFETAYLITGPNKNYQMLTKFIRTNHLS